MTLVTLVTGVLTLEVVVEDIGDRFTVRYRELDQTG